MDISRVTQFLKGVKLENGKCADTDPDLLDRLKCGLFAVGLVQGNEDDTDAFKFSEVDKMADRARARM